MVEVTSQAHAVFRCRGARLSSCTAATDIPSGQAGFLFESSSMLRSFFFITLARKLATLSFFEASSVPASELQSLPRVLLGLIHDVALSQEPIFASIYPRPNDVRFTACTASRRGYSISRPVASMLTDDRNGPIEIFPGHPSSSGSDMSSPPPACAAED